MKHKKPQSKSNHRPKSGGKPSGPKPKAGSASKSKPKSGGRPGASNAGKPGPKAGGKPPARSGNRPAPKSGGKSAPQTGPRPPQGDGGKGQSGRRASAKHGRPPGTKPGPGRNPAARDGRESREGQEGRHSNRYVDPSDNVYNMRVEAIRTRLGELKQYKRILAEEGLEPDQDDKRVETELIRRLLWLEKQQANEPARRAAEKEKAKAADKNAPRSDLPSEDAEAAAEPAPSRRGKNRKR
jgi:hypothetical protein